MKKSFKKYGNSSFLSRFSLLQAFGSVFSITGNYFQFEYGSDGLMSDAEMLHNDWDITGRDLYLATKNYNLYNRSVITTPRSNGR